MDLGGKVLLLCGSYLVIAGMAVSIGYHRMLSHRALALPRWVAYPLIVLGLPAGTPVQWVGTHRVHHANADTVKDPHAPGVHGFWHAHCGWYLGTTSAWCAGMYALAGPLRMLIDAWVRPRTNQEYISHSKDVAADPFYAYLSLPSVFGACLVLHALLPLVVAYLVAGYLGLAGLWFTMILAFNLGDSIDSMAHLTGDKAPGQPGEARDNPLLALLTFGEGWHAAHHARPQAAKFGARPRDIDPLWPLIRFCETIGIATHVRR